MKKIKTMAAAILAAAITVTACVAFTACGADGTYTFSVGKNSFDMSPNSTTVNEIVKEWYSQNAMTGMVAGNVYGQFSQEEAYTLTLEVDGDSYTLTKEMHYQSIYEGSYVFDISFSGTIVETDTENTYTLEKPDSATGTILWGSDTDRAAELMKNNGYGHFADKTVSATDEDADLLMKWFSTAYPVTGECAAMTVVLDTDNMTVTVK